MAQSHKDGKIEKSDIKLLLDKDKLDILRESSSDERIGYELIQKYLFQQYMMETNCVKN